jgi:hypothetical protein
MGHYCGSKECPKTPLSAQIHALGIGAEMGEETSPDRHNEEEEVPFEGLEFDGDANIEFANFESDNNTGSGAIVTNFHIISKSGDEVDIAQLAQLATTSETKCDQKNCKQASLLNQGAIQNTGERYKNPLLWAISQTAKGQ